MIIFLNSSKRIFEFHNKILNFFFEKKQFEKIIKSSNSKTYYSKMIIFLFF